MSQVDLVDMLFKKYYSLSSMYEKVIVITTKDGTHTTKDWKRIALEQQFRDRFGDPSDIRAKEEIEEELLKTARHIYRIAKTEIEVRVEQNPKLKDLLLSDIREKHILNDHEKLASWAWRAMRFIDHPSTTPFDRNYKSTVLRHEGIPIGSKVISEKEATQYDGEANN